MKIPISFQIWWKFEGNFNFEKWKHYYNANIGWQFVGINYFADLRLTFRQKYFLQNWFRNEFGVGLG
jgi:hypothetical protein